MGRCEVVASTATVRAHAQEHVREGKEREIRKSAARESEEKQLLNLSFCSQQLLEVKQVMTAVLQAQSGGFDIPLVQAAKGIPLCACAECTQGVCAGKKNSKEDVQESTDIYRGHEMRGTEATTNEKCVCGHAMKIAE